MDTQIPRAQVVDGRLLISDEEDWLDADAVEIICREGWVDLEDWQ